MTTSTAPVLASVSMGPWEDDPTAFLVTPLWDGVDRPNVGGWVVGQKVALRLVHAVLDGAVLLDPEVRTDVNGQTYVEARSLVRAKTADADLRRLGH